MRGCSSVCKFESFGKVFYMALREIRKKFDILPDDLWVEEISHRDTITLRRELVVPGSSDGVLHMVEDDMSLTRHIGLFCADGMVGVVSLVPQSTLHRPAASALRFYAMVIHRHWRRRGFGQRLVRELLSGARQHGATILWANARPSAHAFYRSTGFNIESKGVINPVTGLLSRVVLRNVLIDVDQSSSASL